MLTAKQIQQAQNIENPDERRRYLTLVQLPEDLKETLFAESTVDKIEKIENQYQLSAHQTWYLTHTVGLVILKEIPLETFSKTIQERCKVDPATARQLTQAVAQEIFTPIKESLQKLHGLESEVKTEIKFETPLAQAPGPDKTAPAEARLPQKPTAARQPDTYRESVETKPKPIPRLEGNIVDLKNRE